MNDFIKKIITNDYFPLIIGITIIVLVIIFIIVFILGKKDQKKLEKTQVLNTINDPNLNSKNEIDSSLGINPVPEVEGEIKQEVVSIPVSENTGVQIAQESTVPVDNVINNPVQKESVNQDTEEITAENINISDVNQVVSAVVNEVEVNTADVSPEVTEEGANIIQEPVENVSAQDNEEVYIANGEETIPKKVIPFDPDPEIEPYIPEDSIQNIHRVTDEIEKDLVELENIKPNVAPVEIVTEASMNNPPLEVPKEEPEMLDFVAPVDNNSSIENLDIEMLTIDDAPVNNDAVENTLKVEEKNLNETSFNSQPVSAVVAPEKTTVEMEIELPKLAETSEASLAPEEKKPEVFSSVYVPEATPVDDINEIELPRLR